MFRSNSARIESLEDRRLLSADIQIAPNLNFAVAAGISGYTPAQIAKAYGFNNVAFGATKGDGTGQTIAIVDAYNDPNIASDLAIFDQQFSLAAPPSFTKVSQTGSTTALPKTDAGWADEISLDVEWAHAMAPGAKILLVEAKSANTDDLIAAVDYARNAAGVSTVSMSWGGSEFSNESSYDSHFTTPAGHQGVTFIAASGDEGTRAGAEWPASSPNVLSVGGTSLNLDSTGAYGSETTWIDSTGGTSRYEAEPSYQMTAQSSGKKSSPDVSYDADPNTGFAVYDSISDGSTAAGWQVVGGTSAGAPQWAAILAIANQGRVEEGASSLNGTTGTLPALYSLYATPTSANYSQYTSAFNDIISSNTGGGGGRFGGGRFGHRHFGGYFGHSFFGGRLFGGGFFGGGGSTSAATGYDTVTGLGTPKTNAIVSALVAKSATTTPSSTTTTKTIATKVTKNSRRFGHFSVIAMQTALLAPSAAPATLLQLSTLSGNGLFSDVEVAV